MPLALRCTATLCAMMLAGATVAQSVPAAPEDGGPRRFELTGVSSALNLRAAPSTGAPVEGRIVPGQVLTNLGCAEAEGRAWCMVQDFRGGPVGFAAAKYLSPARAPDGSVPMGANMSAARAGQGDFDATGSLPCSRTEGQPMGQCAFGVARAGGGDATVSVTRADGTTRVLFFVMGVPLGADTAEADPGSFDFQARKEGDLHLIRVGTERYEVPEAVVFGG